jgi:hypothetical protein
LLPLGQLALGLRRLDAEIILNDLGEFQLLFQGIDDFGLAVYATLEFAYSQLAIRDSFLSQRCVLITLNSLSRFAGRRFQLIDLFKKFLFARLCSGLVPSKAIQARFERNVGLLFCANRRKQRRYQAFASFGEALEISGLTEMPLRFLVAFLHFFMKFARFIQLVQPLVRYLAEVFCAFSFFP